MRIAHISDLHLCHKHKPQNIDKTKRLFEYALENGTEHFVITGDISDNSSEKDYNIFREILLQYDLLRSDRTTIVIGNHDIFGGPQTAQDVLNFPSKCLNTNYHSKVSIFVKYFRELFENTIRPHEELFFPFLKEVKNVLFIGINSIAEYSRFKNPFASNGHVSKMQRQYINTILNKSEFKDKIKIVLAHHHFYPKNVASHSSNDSIWDKIESYTMKLRGKKILLKIFLNHNVNIVLHGHSHEMKEYSRKGIKFLNAGASVDNSLNDQSDMFFIDVFPLVTSASLITLTPKQCAVELEA
jgi:3',5'-cyclic AMP phosphodiesterase CpdA